MKHSKMTAIVLALCMLVTLLVVAPTAVSATTTDGNLVKDSSFENWGPTGEKGVWEYLNPNSKSIVEPCNTESYDGAYSMKFKSTEESTTARKAVYQNLGTFEAGTEINISFKMNIKSIANSYGRLIIRFGGDAGGQAADGKFALVSKSAATDGWVEVSTTGKIYSTDATKDLYAMFETYSSDFEIYVDDFKVEVVGATPKVINGDFETGDFTGWSKKTNNGSNGNSNTIETDAQGNKYAKIGPAGATADKTKAQNGFYQQLKGLTSGRNYYVTFDACTNGNYLYIDHNSDANSASLWAFQGHNTNGEWKNFVIKWTQKATSTTQSIRFLIWNGSDPSWPEDAYVKIDNVVLHELADENLPNPGFEYGANGLGTVSGGSATQIHESAALWVQANSSGYTATYTQVDGGMGGTKAMKVERPIADGIADAYTQIKQDGIALTAGQKYIFTAYVKAGEDFVPVTNNSSCQFYIAATNAVNPSDGSNTTAADWPTKKLSAADGWTRFSLIFTAHSTATSTLTFRTYGTGTFYYDNFSLRKFDGPIVEYAKADGDISKNLVDGGKVNVIVPVAEGDAGNIYALALYNRNGNNKTLLNVKAKTILATDVEAGYASFTLAADTLGADFANVNFAKMIMLKGGSYNALQEYDLLVKAAQ